ncbi:Conserved putative membrane protein [Amycolatopsis japonica]|uniref:Conserved putative membrane protein n=1 Tax=Amycolatopsis japonica TaxID=208439 RepID=A0A075UGW0_9PSEU|nr:MULTISPECIES: MFS transporter [Amycolatopsis]AIG73222.1 Conserved putative membrane protein [Amycolatopsis japonica]OKJ98733.1 MFS transporter [Amycolatopsis sp. CB00013]
MEKGDSARGTAFRAAFAVGEFRALWAAEALSQAGDQLARVALSVLVWERTASAGLTGLTYGLTYLPTLIGGTLFAGLADRYSRRTVMIVCDLVRAAIAALMAVPGIPLPVLAGLLVILTMAGGPFRAAQLALLPDVLEGDRYVAGLAVRTITIQTAQLAGFGGGGLVIGLVTPYWGLVIDAVTFVVSALLVSVGVRRRGPAATESSVKSRVARAFSGEGAKELWQGKGIRVLFGLKMLAGFAIAPEGLAAPLAVGLGAGSFAVGLILAADPIGSVIGSWIFTKWVPARRKTRIVGILAIASVVPLVFVFFRPSLPVCLALIGLSGAFAAPYHLQAVALMARAVPDGVRAQVMGLTSTSLVTVQGIGIMLAGGLAQLTGPFVAVGVAATVAVASAGPMAMAWKRAIATGPDVWLPAGSRTG